MHIKDEQIRLCKEFWKKEYGEDLTDDQALEYSENLIRLMLTFGRIEEHNERWRQRLIEEPGGFALPPNETYSCVICHQSISGNEGWYDQNSVKCRPCQKAVEDGVIPAFVCTDRKSWYSPDDLTKKFGWHQMTIRKKVRNGELKAREIRNGEHHWCLVFLKDENPSIL